MVSITNSETPDITIVQHPIVSLSATTNASHVPAQVVQGRELPPPAQVVQQPTQLPPPAPPRGTMKPVFPVFRLLWSEYKCSP